MRDYEYHPSDADLLEEQEQAASLQAYMEWQEEKNWEPRREPNPGTIHEAYGRLRKAARRHRNAKRRRRELSNAEIAPTYKEMQDALRECDFSKDVLCAAVSEYRRAKQCKPANK